MLGFKKRSKNRKKKKTVTEQNGKKRKLTREEKKLIKKRRKRAAKRRAHFVGQKGFFNDSGYIEYDGYVRVGKDGEYMTIYDVHFKYGTYNPAPIGWLNMLIPSSLLQKGKIYFAYREKGMLKSTEDDVLSHRLRARQVTMQNQKESSDVRETSKKEAEMNDIALTKQLAKSEHIIDSDISLIVKAKTPERLEETVRELRQNYKDRGIVGVMLTRKTSQQMEAFLSLPHHVYGNSWHGSDMETVAASRMFLPSSGFADAQGTVVGTDIHSYLVNTPSIIDFNNIRHAVIMTGGIKGRLSIGGVEGSEMVPNFGSAWAHVIADDNYLVTGTRTHHICLVPFNYHAYDNKVFDLSSNYTINSLETYGRPETVEQDANANFDKIVEIILMLMEDEDPDPAIRGTLYNQLLNWMIFRANGNGLYSANPDHEPTLANRILATQDHQTYPTLQDFIPELQSMVAAEAKKGEDSRKRAEIILNAVRNASYRFPKVFNAKTNIPDKLTWEDRNIYYDLSHLGGSKMIKGAMFLNALAYVTNRAAPGDMIVIHGIDAVKVKPSILKPYRDIMDRKDVGLITTFEERNDPDMNPVTLNDFIHPLVEQDLVIIGGIQKDSQQRIEDSWSRSLPQVVADDLSNNQDCVYYVYRARDFGSAVINTHLIL